MESGWCTYQWWWVVRTNLRLTPCELAVSRTFSGSTGSTTAPCLVLSSTILVPVQPNEQNSQIGQKGVKKKKERYWKCKIKKGRNVVGARIRLQENLQIGIIVLEARNVIDSHALIRGMRTHLHSQFANFVANKSVACSTPTYHSCRWSYN